MSSPRRALTLLALLLAFAAPSLANEGKKDEVFVTLFGPWLLGLMVFPVGLAIHGLVLAYAPRRGAVLVHNVEQHRWKTLVLGGAHAIFFFLLAAGAGNAGAGGFVVLVCALWLMLAFVGSHGLARSIGARVLDVPSDGPGDLKALAVGWFVLVFASAFPGLGWLLALYWGLRATGGVVLTLFSVPEPPTTPIARLGPVESVPPPSS